MAGKCPSILNSMCQVCNRLTQVSRVSLWFNLQVLMRPFSKCLVHLVSRPEFIITSSTFYDHSVLQCWPDLLVSNSLPAEQVILWLSTTWLWILVPAIFLALTPNMYQTITTMTLLLVVLLLSTKHNISSTPHFSSFSVETNLLCCHGDESCQWLDVWQDNRRQTGDSPGSDVKRGAWTLCLWGCVCTRILNL